MDEPLIGRDEELRELTSRLSSSRSGPCSVTFLAGEAGVGKTALARAAIDAADAPALVGFGIQDGTPPYGPLVDALRGLGWRRGTKLGEPLRSRLATLLPELGSPAPAEDRTELFDAIRSAFDVASAERPRIVFLDDLQWADHATLEILPTLVRSLGAAPVAFLCAYRSDDVARDHPLRRTRAELRRTARLHEIAVHPLVPAASAALLARVLGAEPGPALAAAVFERTDGVPFFVEQLGAAVAGQSRLDRGSRAGGGLELSGDGDLPLPESVRDAVLLRAAGLPKTAVAALAIAAVAGQTFDPDLVVAAGDLDEWPDDLRGRGLVDEADAGLMAFRHSLIREAFYAEVPRTRRAALHRAVAGLMQERGAPPAVIAEHWARGRDPERARLAFVDALLAFRAVHAYRDGAAAARRALELWPDGAAPADRLAVLERLGECAELGGDLSEAATTWREVAELCHGPDDAFRLGNARRRLAAALELQGRWEDGIAAREEAAVAFDAAGAAAEAAEERLASAAHLRSAARFHAALDLLDLAAADARRASRLDLQVRILGLEGNVRARMGEASRGVELVRTALTTALEGGLSVPAAEIYQRLADSLEHAGDYPAARATYDAAVDYCAVNALAPTAQLCLACLTVVLRQTGEWDRAATLCREVLASTDASPHARGAASGTLGSILCLRGQTSRAKPLLAESASVARRIELLAMEVISGWGLALLDQAAGDVASALARCRTFVARWAETEERHYAISPLRWAVTLFVEEGDVEGARMCASALSRIATDSPREEAMSALSHALGEMSLLEGDVEGAVLHFGRAVDLLVAVGAPFERIESNRRAGTALATAGRSEEAVDRFSDAYRMARRLRAGPMAERLGEYLAALGGGPGRSLGPALARGRGPGGLTRREVEVVRLVALGRTNREIARDLFLSPRTVEMHVQNIRAKLDCRSRADAVRRAGELGLLQNEAASGSGHR